MAIYRHDLVFKRYKDTNDYYSLTSVKNFAKWHALSVNYLEYICPKNVRSFQKCNNIPYIMEMLLIIFIG